ncbi:MAG: hypothetical protein JXO22_14005 [Phycisphaerae bacterium]|nr:hypothetical protein [Phycisphaerae bacterium]
MQFFRPDCRLAARLGFGDAHGPFVADQRSGPRSARDTTVIRTRERAVITQEQYDELSHAIDDVPMLREVRDEIVQAQKVVFHDLKGADWTRSEAVARQIMIADLSTRHHGDVHRMEEELRQCEQRCGSHATALQQTASYIHSYFTTPLGIMMRCELFGDGAVFLSPEALKWIEDRAEARGHTS